MIIIELSIEEANDALVRAAQDKIDQWVLSQYDVGEVLLDGASLKQNYDSVTVQFMDKKKENEENG